MNTLEARGSSSTRMVLPNCGAGDLSFAMRVEPGPVGGVWLRPETAWGHDSWKPEPVVSRWSPADLRVAADWFEEAAKAQFLADEPYMWFGSPGVAFGLVEAHEDRLAIDVCLTADARAPWPTFTGMEAVPSDGDDSHLYLTIDLTRRDCEYAATTWRCWADTYGRVALVRN